MHPHHHTRTEAEPVAETYSELAAPTVAYVLYTIAALVMALLAVYALLVDDGPWVDLIGLVCAAACGWTLRTLRAMREEARLFNLVDGDISHATETGTPVRPVQLVTVKEETAA